MCPRSCANCARSIPGYRSRCGKQTNPWRNRCFCAAKSILAITEVEGSPAGGLQSVVLARLPLVLLVPEKSPLKNAKALFARDPVVAESLISLPAHETVVRNFREGLRALGRTWDPALEVSSIDLIETYVAEGFGPGLSVAVPGRAPRAGLRALPLPGFQPVVVAALWAGKLHAVPAAFLDLVKARAALLRQAKPN